MPAYAIDVRRLLAISLLLIPALARADGAYRAPIPTTPIDPLPPGAWFREGYQDWVLEDEPAAPRWAAIAGSFGGDRVAERAARALDRTRLGLGYPWVVAAHELRIEGRCRESIVVVAGLFATREDGAAWQAQHPSRVRLELVALEHQALGHQALEQQALEQQALEQQALEQQALEQQGTPTRCAWEPDANGLVTDSAGRHLEITHVDPSADAPGYDAATLEADGGPSVRERLAAARPVCVVRRGSVHAFRGHQIPWRLGWGFAPARCGGRVVYVPTESTLRAAVFERTASGETRVHQITDVSCDSAHFDVWTYSLDGRAVIEAEPPTFSSRCAG